MGYNLANTSAKGTSPAPVQRKSRGGVSTSSRLDMGHGLYDVVRLDLFQFCDECGDETTHARRSNGGVLVSLKCTVCGRITKKI